MADKFPALEDIDGEVGATNGPEVSGDLASRERELLGDDAQTFAKAQTDEAAFESSFPAVAPTASSSVSVTENVTIDRTSVSSTPGPSQYNLDESEPVREWRERRELEIQRRDELLQAKKAETQDTARKAIDDFYDNYNNKKEAQQAQTKTEADRFLEDRDKLAQTTNTWAAVSKLTDAADKKGPSEKSRFRELLVSLAKDENAPGAAGY